MINYIFADSILRRCRCEDPQLLRLLVPMGQPPEVSVLQRFTTDHTKDAAPYLHLPYTAMPYQRVCKPAHGSFRPTQRATHR